jgi:hypothetical protein
LVSVMCLFPSLLCAATFFSITSKIFNASSSPQIQCRYGDA